MKTPMPQGKHLNRERKIKSKLGWFHDGSGHLWHASYDGQFIKFQRYRNKKSFRIALVEVFNMKILALHRNQLLVRIHGAGDLQRTADLL